MAPVKHPKILWYHTLSRHSIPIRLVVLLEANRVFCNRSIEALFIANKYVQQKIENLCNLLGL